MTPTPDQFQACPTPQVILDALDLGHNLTIAVTLYGDEMVAARPAITHHVGQALEHWDGDGTGDETNMLGVLRLSIAVAVSAIFAR